MVKTIIYFSLLSIITSCTSQKPPEVEPLYHKSNLQNMAVEICNQAKTTKDVFYHENVKTLFKCLRWNEKFPNLFKAIEKIKTSHWDQIFAPLDRRILNEKEKRNNFLKNFKILEKKEGLDDFAFLLKVLNESNFYDGMYRLLKCSQRPNDSICFKERNNILPREDLKKLFSHISPTDKGLDIFIENLEVFVLHARDKFDDLSKDVDQLKKSIIFKKDRNLFFNELFNYLRTNGLSDEVELLKRVLVANDISDSEPFLYLWPRVRAATPDKFTDFILFSSTGNNDVLNDIQALNKVLQRKTFVCKNVSSDKVLKINLKDLFDEFLDTLRNGDRQEYLKGSIEKAVLIQMTGGSCPNLNVSEWDILFPYAGVFVRKKHELNILKFIDHINDFVGEHFEINKFLLNVLKGYKDGDLFSLLSERTTLSALNFLKTIHKISPNLFDTIYKIIIRFEPHEYYKLVELFDLVSSNKELVGSLKKIGVLWEFFNEKEKNFLFNFLDAHFDQRVNLSEILTFYISIFKDGKADIPHILGEYLHKDKIGKTLDALENISMNLKGDEVLNDFRKFFSREHLLTLVKVLAEGLPKNLKSINDFDPIIGISKENFEKAFLDNPDLKLKLNLSKLKKDDYYLYKCLQKISNREIDFYSLSDNFKIHCQYVGEDKFLFKVLRWMEKISDEYSKGGYVSHSLFKKDKSRKFHYNNGKQMGLLDETGLMSPQMFEMGIQLLSVLDSKIGINNILKDLEEFLYKENPELISKINESINFLNNLKNIDEFRVDIFKKLSKKSNFNEVRPFISNLAKALKSYGNWIGTTEYNALMNPLKEVQDTSLTCDKFLNTKLGHNPCPKPEELKKSLKRLITLILEKKGDKSISALDFLLKAMGPDYQIELPLNHKDSKRYHFSVERVFDAFFNLSDPELEINNRMYPIIPKDTLLAKRYLKWYRKNNLKKINAEYFQKFNSIERVEFILRNLAFDDYNILVGLANGTAFQLQTRESLEKSLKILEMCASLKFCGRFLNRNERINVFNALILSEVFFDVEEYKHFKYGTTIQAIVSSSVVSSDIGSRKEKLFYSKEDLKGHNAALLAQMGEMGVGSNLGRFIVDRIGPSRVSFNKFLNRKDFKLFNQYFLKGFPLSETQRLFEKLTLEFLKPESREGRTLLDLTIDWISSLDYSDLRLFEDGLINFLSLGGYLGPLHEMKEFSDFHANKYKEKYHGIHLFPFLKVAPELVKNWPILIDHWPKDIKFMDVIKAVNAFSKYLKFKLESGDVTTYENLNDLFKLVKTLLLDEGPNKVRGLDIILDFIKDQNNLNGAMELVEYSIQFFKDLHYKEGVLTGERFIRLGESIEKISDDPSLNFDALRTYFKVISHPMICREPSESDCVINYHYDEIGSLIRYLGVVENKKTNFERLLDTLILRERDNIYKFSKEILKNISFGP